MSLWNSETYRADVARAADILDINKLYNKRILVTGASGLICSAIVDLLLWCNREKQANIIIYAGGRNEEKLRARFQKAGRYEVVPFIYDATKKVSFEFEADYIIHGASNASPDKYMLEPVDTLIANVLGVANLLQYANSVHAAKTVYISSSEVYGKLPQREPLTENIYGDVDVLSVRSAYPMGKRAAETLSVAYASQFGVDVSIVRPGHIYGPTAQISDNRVSSLFAREAAQGKNIVMKSAGTQIRSYCYCLDCATAVLAVLTRGVCGEAYNISNQNSVISIRQMAELTAQCAGVELIMDLPTEAEKTSFNPMDNSSLDARKLESLGWHGLFDAETGFRHTVRILQESNKDVW